MRVLFRSTFDSMLLSQMLKRKVSLPPGGKARIDCLHSHVLCPFLVTARAVCVPVSFETFHVRIAGCCFVGITVIRRGPVTFRAFAAFALLLFHSGLLYRKSFVRVKSVS